MTIAEAIRDATEKLTRSRLPDALRDANLLLANALSRPRAFLIAHPEYKLTPGEASDFNAAIERRGRHEPVQHITGVQEFYGLDFRVSPAVLIPRPETELIVERAIKVLAGRAAVRFCEVGVGSGCISISILKNVAHATAVATDISAAALEIARQNAEAHGVADRLDLRQGDLFTNVDEDPFDAIVSNPPYVSAAEMDGLDAEVRDFEPRSALTDGGDGLSIVRRLVDDAPRYLRPGGTIMIEFGFGQAGRVSEMFDPSIWRGPELVCDLQGIPRIAIATRNRATAAN